MNNGKSTDISPLRRPAVRLSLFCALSSLFILSGCVTDDIGKMKWELNELRTDVNRINEKSESMETQFPGQKKQFDKKTHELEESQKATAETVSDLLIRVQALTSEVQTLTGRVEENKYFSEKSSAEQTEGRNLMLAKLKELETAVEDLKKEFAAQKTAPAPAEGKAEKEGAATTATPDKKDETKTSGKEEKTNAKDVYMAGYQAYKDNRSKEAKEKFLSVINSFPENEYTDNARFWLGETYYRDENYEDAILAYEELFRKNPDSDKIPAAMLKQGLAFFSLKDSKTGKIILEKLIEKYPGSEQAELAKKKLNKPTAPKKK